MNDLSVEAIAETKFGVRYLFPYQRLVIANILECENPLEYENPRCQLVILPTGAGKTLCFQLPALLLPGLTVAVYPLRSLMDDQARRSVASGIDAVMLRGGQTAEQRRAALDRIADGTVRMVITNPETLHNETVQRCLQTVPVSHFVVDEAHCVSEWGDTFRPTYRDLGVIRRSVDPRVVTAFTATASPAVLSAIRCSLFGDEPVDTILGNPDRVEIGYTVIPVHSRLHALRVLATGCSGRFPPAPSPLLVFCRSRDRVEAIARILGRDRHCPVCAYHAGMTSEERRRVEEWFLHCEAGGLHHAAEVVPDLHLHGRARRVRVRRDDAQVLPERVSGRQLREARLTEGLPGGVGGNEAHGRRHLDRGLRPGADGKNEGECDEEQSGATWCHDSVLKSETTGGRTIREKAEVSGVGL